MNRKWWKLIFVFPIFLCILYAGGYIAQFIGNYKIWTSAGNFAGNGSCPKAPSLHPMACLHALAQFPYNLYGIFLCFLAFGLLVFLLMRMGVDRNGEVFDKERNLNYSLKGTYGTSGFMTPDEMYKVLELTDHVKKTKGTILGKLNGKAVCLPYETRMNRNIAVYGASGSMKSRAFARNMLFQCVARGKNGGVGESLIITDPKSELYESMAGYLENEGYTVRRFNLVNPENSDAWNCLMEIDGQETMAQVFSDVIIQNTGSAKGEHFWDNAELNLLKALVLYVEQGFPLESKNIGQVYKLLALSSEKELNSLFDLLPVSHPAKVPYCIYKQASDTVRSGVIIGLGARLQVFQNKLIRQITSYDEIDLTLPGKQKCAYFCITSDQDSAFDFLSSLFMTFVFIKLVRFADKHGVDGHLPVPVHILADELANTGAILELNKKISVCRSRGLSISCIFQNLPQMQNRYPFNQWQEIIGNCDTQLFLGCTDEVTAEFISSRSGDVTVGVSSEAKQLNTWRVSDYSPEYRKTQSIGKRKLLTPDEILRLPLDTALIILRGQKVLKVQKYDYTLHPDAKKLVTKKVAKHIPKWREEGKTEEYDYLPKAPPKPRRQRSGAASAPRKPLAAPTHATPKQSLIAIVYYKEFRTVIPITEMMINLVQDEFHDYGDISLRQNKVLNNMLGCEIDFIVKGLDAQSRSVVASRKEAMLKKRQIFYLDRDASGGPKIYEDRIVQARVVAVAEKVVRAEIFGVETSILARDLSFDWLGDARERFHVGEHILVRILSVTAENTEKITVKADVKSVAGNTSKENMKKSVAGNTSKENMKKCKIQGKYAGTVEDIHKGTVFVRLSIGVNAIAHSCYDNRTVGKKDEVSFVVTHIDEERNVAVGLISRIIRQNL